MSLTRLVTFSLFLLCGCATQSSGWNPTGNGAAAPTLSFLHLNDTYRIDAVEDGERGGFGRVTTVIRRLQARGHEVRLLHGGDFLYPSLESQLWNGEQMIEAFNFMHALAPMTAVPGNHEFDRRTPEAFVNAMDASNFEWLAANVRLDTGRVDIDERLPGQRLLDIDGRKVGVFALSLHPEDGGNNREYTVFENDYLLSARRAIERLQQQGADLIVGLTHLHMEDDLRVARLKADYPRFLFLVGGHEHEPEHSVGTPDSAEVMKGASNARSIWQIDVTFGVNGEPTVSSSEIPLDTSVLEDPEYQAIVAGPWRARLLETVPFLPSRIGKAAVPFDAREVTIRNTESNWGNFVVDQMRGAFGEPQADLAVLNSGTLRIDDYIAGDITFEDVARTFGFSSLLRYLKISGAEFRETMEAGFRGEGPSKGYFPQVSGFRLCVDRQRPSGERIVQLQVPMNERWQSIDDDTDYLLVAPDYLLGGGDGYQFPEHRERSRPGSELKYRVLDAIVSAQASGQKVGEAVDPDNPRIAFLRSGQAVCF